MKFMFIFIVIGRTIKNINEGGMSTMIFLDKLTMFVISFVSK